jgi:release factor glutamine methyltransferase
MDAEILLMHALGVNRSYLRAWPERAITANALARFEGGVGQRMEGHPIAYLIGQREFWSRSFIVTPGVLIPRPASELLVEQALRLLPDQQPAELLDLGTGSGVLGITLAAERPNISVTAIDHSAEALEVARQNAERMAPKNIRFILSNWLEEYDPTKPFDLIVSNPPYIRDQDPHLTQGDLRFEPRSALASGEDGLDALRIIIREAKDYLKPQGSLLLEHGYRQASAVATLLQQFGYRDITHAKDLEGHWRCTMARYGTLSPESS